MNMNMQNIIREAQKMQNELKKTQENLEKSQYDGKSSLVEVILNGKKEIVKLTINNKEELKNDDLEMLEDMIMIAFNDAVKKVDSDKEAKIGKYGKGLSGLL